MIEIVKKVGSLLADKKESLGVAESCTGGFLGNKITTLHGCSSFFDGGIIAYNNRLKIDLLNVPAGVLKKFGAVSKEVADEMACGLIDVANVDYAIAITGIAGPNGGSKKQPAGTVFIGVADRENSWASQHFFPYSRIAFKRKVSETALMILLKVLIEK